MNKNIISTSIEIKSGNNNKSIYSYLKKISNAILLSKNECEIELLAYGIFKLKYLLYVLKF